MPAFRPTLEISVKRSRGRSSAELVRERAYQLWQQDPSRSPDENWVLAEKQLQTKCQPSLRCFLLVVLFAFLIFLALGWIHQTMLNVGLNNWPFSLFYYVVVATTALFLIHLVAVSKALQQGLLWPFIGLVEVFRKEGKSVWDFFDLVGGAALLGLVASVISYFVTLSNQRSQVYLQREKENQQLLVNYVKDVTSLVDGTNREYEQLNDDLRISISTRTLNTIQALSGDSLRQGDAIRFASRVTPMTICESGSRKEGQKCSIPDNIPISGLRLRNFYIDGSNDVPKEFFQGTNLSWSDFQGSNFAGADLSVTNLRGANLAETSFSEETVLIDTDLGLTNLSHATFRGNVRLDKVKGLDTARFNDTTLSLESALPAENSTWKGLGNMCLLVRGGRIRIEVGDLSLPAEAADGFERKKILEEFFRNADVKNRKFREVYNCNVAAPDAREYGWLSSRIDHVRLALLDGQWFLSRMVKPKDR